MKRILLLKESLVVFLLTLVAVSFLRKILFPPSDHLTKLERIPFNMFSVFSIKFGGKFKEIVGV